CLCPANALLPKVSSGTATPLTSDGSAGQAPVCDCSRFRGDDTSSRPVAGPVNKPPPSPPQPPPTQPESKLNKTIDTVNSTTDTVNSIIDDALNSTPLAPLVSPPPITVPTIPHVGP